MHLKIYHHSKLDIFAILKFKCNFWNDKMVFCKQHQSEYEKTECKRETQGELRILGVISI